MLSGIVDCAIDAKGRVVVPQNFREELGSEVVLTYCDEKCLCIYSKAEYDKLFAKIMEGRRQHLAGVDQLVKFYIQASWQQQFDGSGRVTLSQEMRTRIGYSESSGEKLKVMGSIDHVEIWSCRVHDDVLDNFDKDELRNAKIELEI